MKRVRCVVRHSDSGDNTQLLVTPTIALTRVLLQQKLVIYGAFILTVITIDIGTLQVAYIQNLSANVVDYGISCLWISLLLNIVVVKYNLIASFWGLQTPRT